MTSHGFSKKTTIAIAAVFLLKTVTAVFILPLHDPAWIFVASRAWASIQNGAMPSVSAMGVYTGMGIFLAPFFGAWSALPIDHPPLGEVLNAPLSTGGYMLVFLMELPIILFDLFAGLLIASIARTISSTTGAAKAFFTWYLNPYAFYLMEYLGTIDIVPTTIVLLSVLLAIKHRWAAAGFSLSVASLLRLYPIFAFPALVLYMLRQRPTRTTMRLIFSFAGVVLTAILIQGIASGSLTMILDSIVNLPSKEPWLLLFYAFPITDNLAYTPLVVAAQIYLIAAFWKGSNDYVPYSVLAPLLALLLASYHQPYHFTWVVPLLSLYHAVNAESPFLFSTIFVGAFLASLGFDTTNSTLIVLQPLFAATFYGAKAAYLIRINWQATRFSDAHGSASRRTALQTSIPTRGPTLSSRCSLSPFLIRRFQKSLLDPAMAAFRRTRSRVGLDVHSFSNSKCVRSKQLFLSLLW